MIFSRQCPPSLCVLLFATAVAVEWVGRTSSRQLTDVKERKLPLFRPLRRVVRNFANQRTASITIVFQRGSTMPEMRWFRQVEPGTLPHAEFPDMINIDGDPRYRLRTISSHDVTAVTLVIQPLETLSSTVRFVTCFSYRNESFQYQLDTVVEEPTERKQENLDGIIWRQAPESHAVFAPELKIDCAVTLESESTRFTDELNIYRNFASRERFKNGTYGPYSVTSSLSAKMHKERGGYTEMSGKYLTEGRWYNDTDATGRRIRMHYEVKFTVLNGSSDDMGVYMCAAERANDKTYISSWVYATGLQTEPIMLFEPCEDGVPQPTGTSPRGLTYQIRLTQERPSCVRCRVYARLPAHISLMREGHHVEPSSHVQIDRHINVADGGMSELTVTFLNPLVTRHHANDVSGRYICSSGNDRVQFDVSVIRPSVSGAGQRG